jgi:hypothetical protein
MKTGETSRLPRALAGLLAAAQVLFGLPILVPISTAEAQLPKPHVWIAPMTADDVAGARLLSEKFDEAVRKQLSRSNALVLTDQVKATTVSAGEADPRVAKAELLRVAGKETLAKGDAAVGMQQLNAALKLYEEGLASVQKLEAVGETLAFLAEAAIAQDFGGDAKDYLKRLTTILGDADLPAGLSGKTRAMYDKVRSKLLRKKRGTLKITTTPPGAEVRIDGLARGKTPVLIKDLVRGDHYVQVEHPEAGLGAQRVRVKGGKVRDAEIALSKELGPGPAQAADAKVTASLVERARKGTLDQTFRDQADAIAVQVRARYVVVGHIAPQGNGFVLSAYLYGTQEKQTAAFDQFKFRAELSSVFVQAANFASAVEKAVTNFPFERVVHGSVMVAATPRPPPVRRPTAPATEAARRRPPPPEKREPTPEELALAGSLPDEPMDLSGRRTTRPDDDDDPWYGAWWVWTLVGVAVVGGTAYGGYILLDDDGQTGFRGEVEWRR